MRVLPPTFTDASTLKNAPRLCPRGPFDALWDASLDELSGRGSHMKCRGTWLLYD